MDKAPKKFSARLKDPKKALDPCLIKSTFQPLKKGKPQDLKELSHRITKKD